MDAVTQGKARVVDLARRLGVHASTLHRYCSGEAVPQDFAVIERFAALCGASPGELSPGACVAEMRRYRRRALTGTA